MSQYIVRITEPENTFIYSDPHFGHTNIIKYCNRPFSSISEMNEVMLAKYHMVVKPDSKVIFLGDMAYGRNNQPPRWWLKQLDGKILYLKGSHDKGITPTSTGLENVVQVLDRPFIVNLDGKGLYVHMAHDPFDVRDRAGLWLIHGHNHNNRPLLSRFYPHTMCVCVENTEYAPIPVMEIIRMINER